MFLCYCKIQILKYVFKINHDFLHLLAFSWNSKLTINPTWPGLQKWLNDLGQETFFWRADTWCPPRSCRVKRPCACHMACTFLPFLGYFWLPHFLFVFIFEDIPFLNSSCSTSGTGSRHHVIMPISQQCGALVTWWQSCKLCVGYLVSFYAFSPPFIHSRNFVYYCKAVQATDSSELCVVTASSFTACCWYKIAKAESSFTFYLVVTKGLRLKVPRFPNVSWVPKG